ncbi:hypothetical protein KVH22_21765 [Streptomyces olivaceus]|uniref:hypothetical protein n=1 Tax=Streptomyces olivaceus TaxID=47716 RepID=UPI001CCB9CFD|nr:hypothetical protein [Streptomyces olivaceus]MBZ6258147.1 hypothetical protein [Streptomyces olivaceus]
MKPTAQRRRDRRNLLDNLLSRALRGRLSAAEAALLAEQVREEQRVCDETRTRLADSDRAIVRHREAAADAIRELEQRAVDAERRHVEAVAEQEHVEAGDAAAIHLANSTATAWKQRALDAEEQLTAYRSVLGPRPLDRIREAEAEAERYKTDCLNTCATVAAMHAAATGRSDRGPDRGVVEDVADVRARMLAAEQHAKQVQRRLAGYEAVYGPNAVDDFHTMQHRAKTAEADRDALAAELEQWRPDDTDGYGHPVHWTVYNDMHKRAAEAEGRLARIRGMADAWESRLPAAIRTATAAEAVRNAANGDDRPVMFGVAPAPADDQAVTVAPGVAVVNGQPVKQRADCTPLEWAEQERARFERLYTRETVRADKAEARAQEAEEQAATQRNRATMWRREAIETDDRADRYRLAWYACRRDRRADRAAMAAELPAVEAGHKALAAEAAKWWMCHVCGTRTGSDPCHICETDRPEPDQPGGTPFFAVRPARRTSEVITDRAAIRNTLDEPAEEPKPASLATPCPDCTHPRNWHTSKNGPCTFGNGDVRCGCPAFRRTAHARP